MYLTTLYIKCEFSYHHFALQYTNPLSNLDYIILCIFKPRVKVIILRYNNKPLRNLNYITMFIFKF